MEKTVMRMTKGTKRIVFDPAIHMNYKDAAKLMGFQAKYFSRNIAPAYRLQKYTDGTTIFYERNGVMAAKERLTKRTKGNGTHSRGTLPPTPKRNGAVRSDFGKPRNPTVEIVATPKMIRDLIRDGINIKFVSQD